MVGRSSSTPTPRIWSTATGTKSATPLCTSSRGPGDVSRLRRPRFGDLSLFAKLLVPFFLLLFVVGASGAFLVVRDLSSRAHAQLNEELLLRSLDARSRVHDRELYLLEAVDFAANLEGMAAATQV